LTDLSADTSDVWTLGGQKVTVIARDYRLILDGAVVDGPQTDPVCTLPVGSSGRIYSYQVRALVDGANGIFSPWAMVVSGTVIPNATVPDAFQASFWTIAAGATAGTLDINVLSIPSDGGSAITALEYNIDGSGFTPMGDNSLGAYQIDGLTLDQTYALELRAVNGTGPSANSDSKSVTTNNVPAAFSVGQWGVDDLGTGNDIRITINSLPANSGAPLTRL
jgi:hypothetical protein